MFQLPTSVVYPQKSYKYSHISTSNSILKLARVVFVNTSLIEESGGKKRKW